MTTAAPSTALATIQPVFTDPERRLPGRSQAPQPCFPSHASLVTRAAGDLLRPEREYGFTSHRVADGAGCPVVAFVTSGAVGVCRHTRRLGGRSPQDSTVRIVKMASRPTSPRA